MQNYNKDSPQGSKRSLDFVKGGNLESSEPSKKKTALFNLRTGEPFDIKENDIHGRTRSVSEFEKVPFIYYGGTYLHVLI